MKKPFTYLSILFLIVSSLNLAMAGRGQYDEEARAAERRERELKKSQKESAHPVKNIAGGIKQATYDSTTGLLSDTAEGTKEDAPVIGTIEGARKGSEKVVDNAVKGAFKIATLGYGDVDTVKREDPEENSGEPTKFSIAIPGT